MLIYIYAVFDMFFNLIEQNQAKAEISSKSNSTIKL